MWAVEDSGSAGPLRNCGLFVILSSCSRNLFSAQIVLKRGDSATLNVLHFSGSYEGPLV